MEATTLKKTMSLRISPALYEHLKTLSSKENRSINNYVETMLFKVSNFEEKQTYSDETGDKNYKKPSRNIKKGETIKITPKTLWGNIEEKEEKEELYEIEISKEAKRNLTL